MVYVPKLPDESVNISERNIGIYGLKVIVGFSVFILVTFFIISVFAVYFVQFVPVDVENEIYETLPIDMADDFETADEKYQNYAQALLAKIPQTVLPQGYDLKIKVVKEDDINAFALPGGLILLTTALMDNMPNENALLFVIGHEIGHFHGRDHLEGFAQSILTGTFSALIFGSTGADIGPITGLLSSYSLSHYSRDEETRADEWGVDILNATYDHAGGALSFFEKIKSEEDLLRKMDAMFSTHPLSQKRIDHLRDYIESNGYDVKDVTPRSL